MGVITYFPVFTPSWFSEQGFTKSFACFFVSIIATLDFSYLLKELQCSALFR